MQMNKIKSTNLSAVGYDGSKSILRLEFNDGSIYEYFEVPQTIYLCLLSSKSKGNFFYKNIKNRFFCRKVIDI
jgi:hypothetical protein